MSHFKDRRKNKTNITKSGLWSIRYKEWYIILNVNILLQGTRRLTVVWWMPVDLPSNSCSLRNKSSPCMGRKCCGFTILSTSSFKRKFYVTLVTKWKLHMKKTSSQTTSSVKLNLLQSNIKGHFPIYTLLKNTGIHAVHLLP